MSIFVHKNLKFTNINLKNYCKHQVIEATALRLESPLLNICIMTIYETPSGNFKEFLNR
jgi:hypothetical protein